ncbi:MAG: DUF4340 domain-containing protein [Planctomycetes bacterium]|nr:DUF4340 domain-containing protein [Planctomycetota bacterium]
MKITTTIVLLVLGLALAGYFVFAPDAVPPPPMTPRERPIGDYDPALTSRVEIRNRQGQFTIVRDGMGWRLESGDGAPAVEAAREAVKAILDEVASLKAIRVADESPGQGLENPRATLVLASMRGSLRMRFGADDLNGPNLFVAVDGMKKAMVASPDLLKAIDKDRTQLREHAVVPVHAFSMTACTIERGGEKLALRKQSGNWLLESPIRGRADPERTRQLLNSIATLTAVDFVDDASKAASMGIESPRVVVRLRSDATMGEIVLRVGGDRDPSTVWLARDGSPSTLFAVPASFVEAVTVKADDLRDRRLVLLGPEAVSRLAIRDGDRRVRLARRGDTWFVDEPSGRIAETKAVLDLVDRFRALEATGYASDRDDRSAMGLEPARAEIEIGQAGVDRGVIVKLGADAVPGESRWAVSDQIGEPARVRSADVEPFLQPAFAFESLKALGREGASVRSVTATGVEGPTALVRDSVSGGDRFYVVRADGSRTEVTRAEASPVFDSLATFVVDRWVAEIPSVSAGAEFGLATPETTLTITFAPAPPAEAETRRIIIGLGRTPGDSRMYGLVEGDGRVFEPSGEVRRAIEFIANAVKGSK